MVVIQFSKGFPKKDDRFSKLKNMPDLLGDEKEGKNNDKYRLSIF